MSLITKSESRYNNFLNLMDILQGELVADVLF